MHLSRNKEYFQESTFLTFSFKDNNAHYLKTFIRIYSIQLISFLLIL